MEGLSEQLSDGVLKNLLSLKDNIEAEGPKKILLTLAGKEGNVVTIHHSIPFILTNDKLILLRNEDDEFGQQVYKTLAEKLGTKLVQGREPEYNKEKNSERGVMQADHTSCHFLALGILKDLTKENLTDLIESTKEGVFNPTPTMMKYSQSSKYIENSLSKEGKEQPVKTDGKTASTYLNVNKSKTDDGKVITRITTKFNNFKSQLNQAIAEVGNDSNPQNIATKILENQVTKKEQSEKAKVSPDASPSSSPRATTTSTLSPSPSPVIGRG